jgi:AraC-like DNA-binding protein
MSKSQSETLDSVEFRGNRGDLGRFARQVLKQAVTIDQPSPFEQRIRWDFGDRTGFGSAALLSSGIKLSTAKLSWAQPWAFATQEAATPLKFMLGRGAGPRVTLPDGASHVLAAGSLQVRHSTQTLRSTLEFDQGDLEFEQVSLEIDPTRLKELLGARVLPALLEKLVTSEAPSEMHEQPLPPALWRVFEEVLYANATGISRQLLLEAKGFELLAVLLDELELAGAARLPLTAWDIERLERARRSLLARLVSPPSLTELARSVGLNEFKLKVGFRTLFGVPVFSYLRAERMNAARRLLAQGRWNVTEVAARVGYSNPSKFAAAFRKHFGFPPSAVR